jgi:hypothetical protein
MFERKRSQNATVLRRRNTNIRTKKKETEVVIKRKRRKTAHTLERAKAAARISITRRRRRERSAQEPQRGSTEGAMSDCLNSLFIKTVWAIITFIIVNELAFRKLRQIDSQRRIRSLREGSLCRAEEEVAVSLRTFYL